MIQLIVSAFVEKEDWGSRRSLVASSDHEKWLSMRTSCYYPENYFNYLWCPFRYSLNTATTLMFIEEEKFEITGAPRYMGIFSFWKT